MTFSRKEARARLISKAGEMFRDVITGQRVSQEVDLSAVLALKHNWGMVDWKKVNLHQVDGEGKLKEVPAASFGFENLVAQCEYPLFSVSGSPGEHAWGGFRADILFISRSKDTLLYVENKIGDTIKVHYIEGVLEFLDLQTQFDRPSFAILAGREFVEQNWYLSELTAVLKENPELLKRVGAYIIYWEDIIKSCGAA